jgi:hypothetical protein
MANLRCSVPGQIASRKPTQYVYAIFPYQYFNTQFSHRIATKGPFVNPAIPIQPGLADLTKATAIPNRKLIIILDL